MRNLSGRLQLVLLACILSSSMLLAQRWHVNGEVVSDTIIRFAVKHSGPEYLMHCVLTRCDSIGAATADYVQLFSVPNGQKLQEWRDTLAYGKAFCALAGKPNFIDFNFDGYKDICFDSWCDGFGETSRLMFFHQYNPETKLFEPALQFKQLTGSISVWEEDHTIHTFISVGSSEETWIKKIYKYSHERLVLVEKTERRRQGSGFKLIIQRTVNGVLKTVSVLQDGP